MSRRFFRHGELPLVLLALMDDRPMHGYEVMSELSRLFGPHYRPSPGTVYPAIEALEAERLVAGEEHDGRTIYETTPAGAEARGQRLGFRIHATVYVAVNLMLVLIWAITGAGYPWFLFPLAAWGVGLAAHYATAHDSFRGG